MQKLLVYDNGAIVGYGHIVMLVNGRTEEPTLMDLWGNKLPSAWYELQVTSEKHYVVVPKRIQ